ncbi:unnamed protein product [Rotaria sordida]|uniref:XLF-like N-terminal domain-containing protein n=1 Tax=Rotaria sordida TaxID=392033 RepID=A0A814I8Q8_9BILA|nr:unnamed protein product [Rotaria sordida]CAF1019614.1 unnamed protein product [Rotaria sordida]CAF1062201.1 unnamed protein product [Rotaria sordida]CAF1072418.1 unnamed protein product [Rotaria sordida]CAF1219789.1 unnamed protein product [Rotaria sordida]
MSFEDFTETCSRTFAQTPIRLIRMSSTLSTFAGCHDLSYRHLVLLCQPHFTDNSISIAFYLNGTAYFEHLNEEKIRQRLQLLNNPRKKSFHRSDLQPVLTRLKSMLTIDSIKQDNSENELYAKLLSSRLLSIEIYQEDLKFKFRCEERSEIFEQHYVRQLLIQVKELSQRQTYLCELLEHKDELPQFDSKLFLNTPMTLIDDQEEENDAEILSTSTVGRLWKAAFGRRAGQKFLDICLLKKAYMKALEDLGNDEQEEVETVSSVLTTIVDQAVGDDAEQNDDIGLAARIAKRSIISEPNIGNDTHEMKRLRNNSSTDTVSVQ